MVVEQLKRQTIPNNPAQDPELTQLARLYGLPEEVDIGPDLYTRCQQTIGDIWQTWPPSTRAEQVKRAYTPVRREAVLNRLCQDRAPTTAKGTGMPNKTTGNRLQSLYKGLDYDVFPVPDRLTCSAMEGIKVGKIPRKLEPQVRRLADRRQIPLTDRQIEILEKVITTESPKEAASVLEVTRTTVNRVLGDIADKYGLNLPDKRYEPHRTKQVAIEAARRNHIDPESAKEFVLSQVITDAQREVVLQLNSGSPIGEIAEKRGTAYHTAARLLQKARRRVGAHNNRELIEYLGDLGIIDTSEDTLYARTKGLVSVKEAAEALGYTRKHIDPLIRNLCPTVVEVVGNERYVDLDDFARRLLESDLIAENHPIFNRFNS